MQEALTQCFGRKVFSPRFLKFYFIVLIFLLCSFKFSIVTCKVGIALSIWTLQAGRFFFLWISAVVVLLSCFPESQWFMFWIGFINLRHAPLKKHFLQTPIHKDFWKFVQYLFQLWLFIFGQIQINLLVQRILPLAVPKYWPIGDYDVQNIVEKWFHNTRRRKKLDFEKVC